MRLLNRQHAGRLLAGELKGRAPQGEVVVLALPRGGVPVGYEVARELGAWLDVFLVRKLGVPGHEELAMGALAEGGLRVLNGEVIESARVTAEVLREVEGRQRQEIQRQQELYRGARPRVSVRGQTVILVDDGLATGATMRVAAQAVRAEGPKAVWVAVPAAPQETCRMLAALVDEVVCLQTPESFVSVGSWYEDFGQVTDEQVMELLAAFKETSDGRGC